MRHHGDGSHWAQTFRQRASHSPYTEDHQAAAGLTGWLAVTAGILLRRPAHGRIYRIQFTELQVTLDQDQPWELDGEVMSPARQLTVVVQPGGLLLWMPPESA